MYQFSGKIKTFSLTLITIGFLATGWSFYNGLNKTSADAKAALAAEQHGDHGNTAKNHDNSSAKQETHHNDTNEQNAGEKHHASHNHHDTGHSEERKSLTNYIKCTTDHGLRCMYPYYFS